MVANRWAACAAHLIDVSELFSLMASANCVAPFALGSLSTNLRERSSLMSVSSAGGDLAAFGGETHDRIRSLLLDLSASAS